MFRVMVYRCRDVPFCPGRVRAMFRQGKVWLCRVSVTLRRVTRCPGDVTCCFGRVESVLAGVVVVGPGFVAFGQREV